jgi:hypothetical protein
MKRSSLSLRQRFVRWSLVLVFVIAGTAIASQPAQASHPVENHCVSPFNGVDLNVLFGITKQIVTPFCNQVDSGEQWTAAGSAWLVATSFEAVPDGFVPAGATPLEDFRAKFVGIKYVIDPGTRQEKVLFYQNNDSLWTGTIVGLPAVWPGTLSKLPPLSIGEHFMVVYWVFDAMHCDGLDNVVELNCLGPGEVLWISLSFEVTPGAAQSH